MVALCQGRRARVEEQRTIRGIDTIIGDGTQMAAIQPMAPRSAMWC